jgi:hypothetical protein
MIVERYKQGKTGPEPSGNPTRSHISSSKAGGTGERNGFCLTKYLFHTSKGFLTYHNILSHGANGFTSPLEKGPLRIL